MRDCVLEYGRRLHARARWCVRAYVRVCAHVYVCVCVRVRVCVYAYVHVYAYVYVYVRDVGGGVNTCARGISVSP